MRRLERRGTRHYSRRILCWRLVSPHPNYESGKVDIVRLSVVVQYSYRAFLEGVTLQGFKLESYIDEISPLSASLIHNNNNHKL